jgi:hypothetical protein
VENDDREGVPQLAPCDIEAHFDEVPSSEVQHFFVVHVCSDPEEEENVGGLDPDVRHPNSITRFLILPTLTPRNRPNSKDPIVNFARSVILMSDKYVAVATHLKEARGKAVKENEQNKVQKEGIQKRKAAEREEAALGRAVARTEAQRLKELKAAEQAEVRASRVH